MTYYRLVLQKVDNRDYKYICQWTFVGQRLVTHVIEYITKLPIMRKGRSR